MQPVFFIADLHLSHEHAETYNQFHRFLERIFNPNGQTLYILGDLFEYWIGDDAADRLGYVEPIKELTKLVSQNKQIYFMHGNRDFLVGNAFSAATGIKILDDPTVIEAAGKSCLLKHGDDLCTDDVEHQQFRQMTRSPQWQRSILSKSIEERMAMAAQLRQISGSNTKREQIMDVNDEAIQQQFIDHPADILIHGHTHRPGHHEHVVHEQNKKRIVLGDWHNGMSYLVADESGFELIHSST